MAPGSQKSSHFLLTLRYGYAMDHKKIDTLLTLFALCNSEQMRIKSKFFPLGTWFHSLMRAETQWTVRKKILHQFCNAHNLCTFFQKIFLFQFARVVAMMALVSSQFKTMKPYLWHIQLITYAFCKPFHGKNCIKKYTNWRFLRFFNLF